MQTKLHRAESISALLIGLTIFSMLFLVYSQWLEQQVMSKNKLYQQQQALQLIENQIALKLADKPCESQVEQNQITFDISCAAQRIRVQFPLGEISVSTSW